MPTVNDPARPPLIRAVSTDLRPGADPQREVRVAEVDRQAQRAVVFDGVAEPGEADQQPGQPHGGRPVDSAGTAPRNSGCGPVHAPPGETAAGAP